MKVIFGEHGSVKELYLADEQIAQPWGIETADAYAFFSLENRGWQARLSDHKVQFTDTHLNGRFTVQMREGQWQGTIQETIATDGIERTFTYHAVQDSWAMDIVQRYVFKKTAVFAATIANQTITWDNDNYYHQYPVQQVQLHTKNGPLILKATQIQHPPEWKQVMYVRCSPYENAWVIHLRLLPAIWQREIIKTRLKGNRQLVMPTIVSQPLLKIPTVARYLRYAGENNRHHFRSNAIPLLHIQQGTVITLQSRLIYRSRD
ncbi:MAG: hypothetical protein GY805_39490 [Chloroflexi bacterium]|nr:hypothetical protein [Chloroflexota bacterium]